MASPQKEHGYTAIANELLLALTGSGLDGGEFMIALAVISKTYGWNKKEDQISLTQFQILTKMSRPRVVRSIKSLVRYGVLGSNGAVTRGSNGAVTRLTTTYWIIKDYEKWTIPPPSYGAVTRGSTISTKRVVTVPLLTKDNIQKTDILRPLPAAVPPKAAAAPTKEFIDWWYQQYLTHFKSPYLVNGGKDGSLVKRIVATFGLEEAKRRAEIFFQSDDDFIKKAGFTIGVFNSQINKLSAENKEDLLKKPYR